MKWRVLVWTAIAVAVAGIAGLGVDVAVAGIDKAAGLAGVIVGFCELAALVLGVAARAAERRANALGRIARGASSATTGEQVTEPAAGRDSDSKYVVDAHGAEGMQIGDGNTQRNVFRRSSADR